MKNSRLLLFILFSLSFVSLSAQNEPKQKTPIEIAAEQADKLEKDLELNYRQVYLIDSVLQTNLTGAFNDFENMKAAGRQYNAGYQSVKEMWQKKTEIAFKSILSEEQYKKYLIIIGKLDRKGRTKKGLKIY